ncbi:hypothetical protein VIBNISOn1_600059 [Vibrio nigripulchritudo SOn1]|uniref:Acetyltransferase n=1 Tax=Vibrio nigripulchritudo SOn1 TaxID=1238450 RepID=A0AAV2VVL0_9VIBR|nr:hypothetical protein VIBNISOn1_600059 [Vibrio nigripulchritudo SOn1]
MLSVRLTVEQDLQAIRSLEAFHRIWVMRLQRVHKACLK